MILLTLLKQDLKLGLRNKHDLVMLVVSTLVSALLFPIAIGPEPQILSRVAVGIIWVLVLFATHLAVPTVWRQDMEDGTTEQYRLAGFPLEWVVLSKAISVWLLSFGSLFLLLPFLGLSLGLETPTILVLLESFAIASLPLSFLTVTGGLMTQGQSKSAILSTITLLPLYLPILIFSCSACDTQSTVFLTMLAGICLLMCPVLLYMNAAILRWAL